MSITHFSSPVRYLESQRCFLLPAPLLSNEYSKTRLPLLWWAVLGVIAKYVFVNSWSHEMLSLITALKKCANVHGCAKDEWTSVDREWFQPEFPT